MLFLQLVKLPSLLTQLFGQLEVFTPRLCTNRLQLIIKAVECYWTSCKGLHLFQCAAKSENKDSCIMFRYTSRSKSRLLKSSNMSKENVLSSHRTEWFLGGYWTKKSLFDPYKLRDLFVNLTPSESGLLLACLCLTKALNPARDWFPAFLWVCLIELVI